MQGGIEMPNRFKFRVYVDDIGIINNVGIVGNEVYIDFDGGAYDICDINASDINIMQWTGLYDKKGTEIYEGDIVSIEISNQEKPYSAKVEFTDCSFCFDLIDREYWIEDWNLVDDGHKFTVIGNIYENPELLIELRGF